MTIRTQLRAGKLSANHNEALRHESTPAISMRQQLRTGTHEHDRLKLLVVRAGLKAGAYRRGARVARARGRE
jgi:hypothetical protein